MPTFPSLPPFSMKRPWAQRKGGSTGSDLSRARCSTEHPRWEGHQASQKLWEVGAIPAQCSHFIQEEPEQQNQVRPDPWRSHRHAHNGHLSSPLPVLFRLSGVRMMCGTKTAAARPTQSLIQWV